MSETWRRALEQYRAVEGMLSDTDAAAMVAVLEYQERKGIKGKLAEFGTYKGRSAMLLASYARKDEPLHLVDVATYLEKDKIAAVFPDYTFHQCDSALFPAALLKGKGLLDKVLGRGVNRQFRYVHADGSHTFKNVVGDLKVATRILSDEGVLVIDDYLNVNYPQVAAALYHFLAVEPSDLRVFMIGSNKCYVCRKGNHKEMLRFALQHFPTLMDEFGHPVQISKTDRNDLFDCFAFKRRADAAEDVPFYGTKLYKHFYQPR
jgi:hypothetical protein